MNRIAVIGGGPAGMMAAGIAANHGANVTLLEKNEKLGKKLHITGKGRCNLTNDTDVAGLMSHVVSNPRFLHSAFYALDSVGLMAFIKGSGVPLKTERGGRVFPVSDKADDINQALKAYINKSGATVFLNHAVRLVEKYDKIFHIHTNSRTIDADAVIIATGGLSYPATGSTGDGYKMAGGFGHTVNPTFPSLAPLKTTETWPANLTGLSLKNVGCTVRVGKSVLYNKTGEMMFTPTGVTGPLILSASAFLADKFHLEPVLMVDLKPALTPEQLDARLLRDFSDQQNKNFANALDGLLPQRLINTIITLSEIHPGKKVHTITRQERQGLANLLKNLTLHPTATNGYKEAVITKGGVSTKEINPSTMMSKKIPGLFFAGEVLDVDALTGGYNMQIAFSTGYLAGLSAAQFVLSSDLSKEYE